MADSVYLCLPAGAALPTVTTAPPSMAAGTAPASPAGSVASATSAPQLAPVPGAPGSGADNASLGAASSEGKAAGGVNGEESEFLLDEETSVPKAPVGG